MNTLGWVFILMAGLIVRGVTKGRSLTQIPGDLGDEFMALIESDPTKLKEVLARTGNAANATVADNANAVTNNVSALGVPATNPVNPTTGVNPYDVNPQRTNQQYNATHPSGAGQPMTGGNKPLA